MINMMKNIPDINIYVRFCETDAAGHVSNVSYFIYLEEARTKFFELVGIDKVKEKYNLSFVIANTTCDFIKQAYAKQILSVSARVSRVGTKSFSMEHEIKCSQTGELIAKGSAVIVCFNFLTQKSVEIPLELRLGLEQFLVPA